MSHPIFLMNLQYYISSKSQQLPLVESYNLNVTEVLVSDFKNDFSRIFNFTVGILIDGWIPIRMHPSTRKSLKPYNSVKFRFQSQNWIPNMPSTAIFEGCPSVKSCSNIWCRSRNSPSLLANCYHWSLTLISFHKSDWWILVFLAIFWKTSA